MAGRARDLIAADVQTLITLLSGFSEKEDPENFELCEKFAFSNLLHHRYLSVDSHAVRRSVFGMVTKFMIHGHLEASRRLDSLLNKYLSFNVFKDKDVQWAVLSLLVKLADNPTSHIDDDKFSTPKVEDKEDKSKQFDWTTYSHLCDYLKEGNEQFNTNFNASSDSEEWEDVSECEKSAKSLVNDTSVDAEASQVEEIEDPPDLERQQLIEQHGRRFAAEEWLTDNVQKPWWNTKRITEKVDSVFPSANLARTWDSYCDESTSTISEYKVVREILWMLQAPTTTTLFQENCGQFTVQSNITIPSLTKDSMSCYLNPLCDYFNMIHNLQKFQKEIYPLDIQLPGETSKLPPHTFEAYTSAIIEFLRELQELACEIEKKVKMQEDIYTLYSLNLELAPKLSQLRAVYTVHVIATNGWKETENWLSSARLLSVLYSEALSCMECDTPCILLRVFLKTFRPYVDMIDVWLTEGRLDDYRSEFIIAKKNQTDSEDWGSDFAMRSYVSELQSAGIVALPLLQVIVDRVLHAGRSMQLLQRLDRLAEMRSQHSNRGRMYADFLEALEKEIAQMVKNNTSDPNTVALVEANDFDFQRQGSPDRFPSDVSNQLENLKDNFFMQAFKDCVPFKPPSHRRDIEAFSTTGEIFRRLATYSTCGLIPIRPVMERIISHLIDAKHAAACLLVKTIFLQEFNLSTHLALIRAIYLMEAGDIMHRFCVFIFKDAEHSVLWANSYALTVQLEECINHRYPDHSSKFSVVVREDAKLNGTPSVMDEINVKYTVDWPLTVILSPTNMDYYNSVFQFLLKVKWALWALEELRFAELVDVTSNSSVEPGLRCRARCLQLLRFWLLHSVGSVHTYLMGQVLHSLGLQLERDLEAATDLDSLVRAHSSYVALVHTHCLQPRSSDVIKTAILQMVHLSLELRDLWCQGLTLITDARLISMTEMYIKCHCFLGSVLQTAVETGRATRCTSPLSFSASPALREANLFSDHMKYSLAFLAWQKEPPSGIICPLPKCLHKYLEQGVWNDKRSDTNITAQKLEIFLDNYFLFLSRRKKMFGSKAKMLQTEITLAVVECDRSSETYVDGPCTSVPRLRSSHRNIFTNSAQSPPEQNSSLISAEENKIQTLHTKSSSKTKTEIPTESESIVPSKSFEQEPDNNDNSQKNESCQSNIREGNIVVHAHSLSNSESNSLKNVSFCSHISAKSSNCRKNKPVHFTVEDKTNDSKPETLPGYLQSTCKDHSLSDKNPNLQISEELDQNESCKDSEYKTSLMNMKENDRTLLLNEKTLKFVRRKCVKPNIKHSSKSGRKFYDVNSSFPNSSKALSLKTKALSPPVSFHRQYSLAYAQQKISEANKSLPQKYPPMYKRLSKEVFRTNNSLVDNYDSQHFSAQMKETVIYVGENGETVSVEGSSVSIVESRSQHLNITPPEPTYFQIGSVENWNDKIEELTLHLLKRSFPGSSISVVQQEALPLRNLPREFNERVKIMKNDFLSSITEDTSMKNNNQHEKPNSPMSKDKAQQDMSNRELEKRLLKNQKENIGSHPIASTSQACHDTRHSDNESKIQKQNLHFQNKNGKNRE